MAVIAHSWRARVSGLLILLGALTLLPAQRSALPSGREVVQRHVAAIGGEAAYRTINSIRLRGKMEMAAQNISADFEQLQARPNKLLMRSDIPGVGHTEQGFDGANAWLIDPQTGPRLLKDRERDETMADADFDGQLHPPGHVKELTTMGRATYDGKSAYRVKVVLTSGVEQEELYDTESGLLLGFEAKRATQLGVLPTTVTLRDYKKFGVLLHPTTLIQKVLFVEQTLKVTSVEYNVVRANTFDPPAPIKALIK